MSTETIQQRFDRYGKQEITLLQLCAPLNVPQVYSDDDIEEMQDKLTELGEQVDTLESDLKDEKEAHEALTERLSDFMDWAKGLDFEEEQWSSYKLYTELITELKKTIKG